MFAFPVIFVGADDSVRPLHRIPVPCHAYGVALSFFGERKYPKNAAKTKVFESFAHIGVKSSINFTLHNRIMQI